MATLQMADVYGAASRAGAAAVGTPAGTSVQVTGPNPSSVTGGGQAAGSPQAGAAGQGAALCWVGFALAFVLFRILVDAGGRPEV